MQAGTIDIPSELATRLMVDASCGALCTKAKLNPASPHLWTISSDRPEPRLAQPELLAFMQRIAVTEDAAINELGREARHACRMAVTTVSGNVFNEYVVDRRGSPENPVKPQGLEAKFRANVRGCLSEDDAPQAMTHLYQRKTRLAAGHPLTV